jgi:hypothetical protein
MHHKLTKHGRFCKQNNQLPTKTHGELKDNSIVHSGVIGLMRITSVRGAKYFVTFVDDFLKKIWVHMMKCKGKSFERFKEFRAFEEMQLEYEIKAFLWISGGDSISKE